MKLKYITNYLNHNVLVEWTNLIKKTKISELLGIVRQNPDAYFSDGLTWLLKMDENLDTMPFGSHQCKLVLKPLPLLFEHSTGCDELELELLRSFSKYKSNVDISKCDAYDEWIECFYDDIGNIDVRVLQAPQEIFNYLLSEHYDVYGLIKKGYAIDIGTVS